MQKKELFWDLVLKTVKTLVILFTLFAIGYAVERLPFTQALYFISAKLPVSVFLNAVVSLLGIIVFVKFGAEASPAADGIADFLPGAGKLARSLIKVLALLFAYYAFQDAVYPFAGGYEWAYQALFLGFTLYFLVRAGLQVYHSSEQISRFLVAGLRQERASAEPEKKIAEKATPP